LVALDISLRNLLYVVIPGRRPQSRGRPRKDELARVKFILATAIPNLKVGKLPGIDDLNVLFMPALHEVDPVSRKSLLSAADKKLTAGNVTCFRLDIYEQEKRGDPPREGSSQCKKEREEKKKTEANGE
jgi:hypothetical protein